MCNFFNKHEKIFYKYISLDNNHYAFDLLKGKVYFSCPNQFNDPFDSKIEYKKDMSKEKLLVNYKKACARNNRPFNRKIIDNLSHSKIREMLEKMNNKGQTDVLKIYCLSERYDSILMWSHYANKHQGICIGIKTLFKYGGYTIDTINSSVIEEKKPRTPIDAKKLLTLIPCKYSPQTPTSCDLFADPKELYPFLERKHEDWKYEKEYRIILPQNDILKNPVEIDRNNIAEVILGMKITNTNKKNVINRIFDEFKGQYKPKLFQCKPIRGQYAVEKEDISRELFQ